MKRLIVFFAFTGCALLSNSQTNNEDWVKYVISNQVSIEIPSSLELQKGNYKILADSLKQTFGISTSNAVFQQKGLNNFEKQNNKKYARVMLNITKLDKPISEFSINSNINDFNNEEIEDLNLFFKESFINGIPKNINVKIVKWNGTKIMKVNNLTSINYSFIRKLDNEKPVNVATYLFYKGYYQYEIVLSHRTEDIEYWSFNFQKILESIKFY